MAEEAALREFLVAQFELRDDNEEANYYTFEFNTLTNVAGEGEFLVTLMELPDGNLSVVDYEARGGNT